jgi:hypothetical protein
MSVTRDLLRGFRTVRPLRTVRDHGRVIASSCGDIILAREDPRPSVAIFVCESRPCRGTVWLGRTTSCARREKPPPSRAPFALHLTHSHSSLLLKAGMLLRSASSSGRSFVSMAWAGGTVRLTLQPKRKRRLCVLDGLNRDILCASALMYSIAGQRRVCACLHLPSLTLPHLFSPLSHISSLDSRLRESSGLSQ